MDSCKIFCRLCAKAKVISELNNLEINQQSFQSVVEKLNRLNTVVDFGNSCPKMICFECVTLLESSYDFVMNVENAQKLLCNIEVQNIKIEKEEMDASSDFEIKDIKIKTETPDDESMDNDHISIKQEKSSDEEENEDDKSDILNLNETKDNEKEDGKLNIDEGTSSGNMSWDQYAWSCSVCEKSLISSDELIKHSMEMHNRCNAFMCTICRKYRSSLRSMVYHISTHDKSLHLKCFQCGEKFSTIGRLKCHRKKHIHSIFYCKNCNQSFPDKNELKKHINLYKKDLYKDNTEPECNVCDICGKIFAKSRHLDTHKKTHSEKRYECKVCKMTFKAQYYLTSHSTIHENIKPYSCNLCGKSFRLRSLLRKHMSVHTNSYPFKCDICDKPFKYKNRLNEHIRIHSGIYPYTCKVCGRNFGNYSCYSKHMIKVHETDIRKKKPY